MTTVSEHAANLITLAEQADTLVASFRQLVTDIEDEEHALYRDAAVDGAPVSDAIAGRRRLAHYALMRAGCRVDRPLPQEAGQTVTALATSAWAAFSTEAPNQ